MKYKTLKKHIATLKKERYLLFKEGKDLLEITEGKYSSNWHISGYSQAPIGMTKDDNLSNYTPHYYVNETFSTTCKGTERDAILLFVATGIGKQKQLFTEIVTKTKINIVTCKECNKVILHNIKDKWIVCPHCLSNNSKVKLPGIPLSIAPYDTSNFPDLYPH